MTLIGEREAQSVVGERMRMCRRWALMNHFRGKVLIKYLFGMTHPHWYAARNGSLSSSSASTLAYQTCLES